MVDGHLEVPCLSADILAEEVGGADELRVALRQSKVILFPACLSLRGDW